MCYIIPHRCRPGRSVLASSPASQQLRAVRVKNEARARTAYSGTRRGDHSPRGTGRRALALRAAPRVARMSAEAGASVSRGAGASVSVTPTLEDDHAQRREIGALAVWSGAHQERLERQHAGQRHTAGRRAAHASAVSLCRCACARRERRVGWRTPVNLHATRRVPAAAPGHALSCASCALATLPCVRYHRDLGRGCCETKR